MMQKSGDRRLTNHHFLRRQYGLELSQRDIRLLCHQLPDQVLVRRQSIPLVSTEFGRTDTARFAVEPTKADHRADTHTAASYHHCANLKITSNPALPIDMTWPGQSSPRR